MNSRPKIYALVFVLAVLLSAIPNEPAIYNIFGRANLEAQVLERFKEMCTKAGCETTPRDWKICFSYAFQRARIPRHNPKEVTKPHGFYDETFFSCINKREKRELFPIEQNAFELRGYTKMWTIAE
jgi:hypothetical protein